MGFEIGNSEVTRVAVQLSLPLHRSRTIQAFGCIRSIPREHEVTEVNAGKIEENDGQSR